MAPLLGSDDGLSWARSLNPGRVERTMGEAHEQDISRSDSGRMAAADELLRNVYRLNPHPPVTLPAVLTWSENPLSDRNWEFQFHSLRFVKRLFDAWSETGEERYLERAREVLRSWCAGNPFQDPPSPFSWEQHSASFRTMVLAAAVAHLGSEQWLMEALETHGSLLADHYEARGNHALNQHIGLLAAAKVLDRGDWMRQASRSIEQLLEESVDSEGVTNEQAVGYQHYNYERYIEASRRIADAGLELSAVHDRVKLMPEFLAHATAPDGSFANLGDTEGPSRVIRGTPAEYAATCGEAGSPPSQLQAVYGAGFAFGRTGWGDSRRFSDEAFYSVRFGPARDFHGHADGGSVTLFAHGSPLIVDSGKYNYQHHDPYRVFFVSPQAHNVVACSRVATVPDTPTTLLASEHHSDWDYYHLRKQLFTQARWQRRIPGRLNRSVTRLISPRVAWERKILFIRTPGFMIIEDSIAAQRTVSCDQLWHLPPGSNPSGGESTVVTEMPEGNVLVAQLIDAPAPRLLEGETDPIQGWVSPRFGERLPAPVASWTQRGKRVRYLTLLLPFENEYPLGEAALTENGTGGTKVNFWAYGLDYDVSLGSGRPDVLIRQA